MKRLPSTLVKLIMQKKNVQSQIFAVCILHNAMIRFQNSDLILKSIKYKNIKIQTDPK